MWLNTVVYEMEMTDSVSNKKYKVKRFDDAKKLKKWIDKRIDMDSFAIVQGVGVITGYYKKNRVIATILKWVNGKKRGLENLWPEML